MNAGIFLSTMWARDATIPPPQVGCRPSEWVEDEHKNEYACIAIASGNTPEHCKGRCDHSCLHIPIRSRVRHGHSIICCIYFGSRLSHVNILVDTHNCIRQATEDAGVS